MHYTENFNGFQPFDGNIYRLNISSKNVRRVVPEGKEEKKTHRSNAIPAFYIPLKSLRYSQQNFSMQNSFAI